MIILSAGPVGLGSEAGTLLVDTALDLNPSSLIVDGAANTVISGVISDSAVDSLIKSGLGTLTLTATNTYSGPTTVNGGTLLVNGPVANNNGPVDYDGTFNMTGGFLVAAGSAGMAQAPSNTSTQYALMHVFNQAQAAGTAVRIVSQDGEEIASFTPARMYQSIVVSSPKLVKGGTYLVYSGDETTMD